MTYEDFPPEFISCHQAGNKLKAYIIKSNIKNKNGMKIGKTETAKTKDRMRDN